MDKRVIKRTVKAEKILELAAKSEGAKEALMEIFPEAFPSYFEFSKFQDDLLLNPKVELAEGFSHRAIQIRAFGEYAGKGFYLDKTKFNWELITDNLDELVLVPTRKQEG